MNKLTKILCVILTLVITFSSASIAFAKESVIPVICVHGLGMSPLYTDVGTEKQEAMRPYAYDVKSLLANNTIRNEVLKMFSPNRTVNEDALFKALGDYFRETPLNCDSDGNPTNGTGNNNYWTDSMANHPDYLVERDHSEEAIVRAICDRIGAKNVYTFNYDWRLDICETAAKLGDFVNIIKKQTGAKQVALVGSSLGGAVLSAYIDAFKSRNDVARYVFVNPAIMGVDVSAMYSFDVEINKATALAYINKLETAFSGGDYEEPIKLAEALGDVRVGYFADYLCSLAASRSRLTKLYNTAIKDWIGNIPAYWECIPYELFDECTKQMISIGFLNKNSGLYRKICRYHKVQGRVQSNLKAVKAQGAEVAIIANYGTLGVPATSHVTQQTDVLIDTKYASGGATVASYGFQLTGKDAKGKYVSPDGVINASTCALPDNTWFVRDIMHMQFNYSGDGCKLISALATGECASNISAVKKKYGWSQFVKADSKQKFTNITSSDAPDISGKGWEKKGRKWFYYKNGTMTIGWQKVNGKWYFMNILGEMQTGWQMLGGKWYYLGGNGAMAIGWKKIGSKWYYFNRSGVMQTGWIKSGGKWYYLNDNGDMRCEKWVKYKGKWYYLDKNGAMRTAPLKYKGKWYYFNSDGSMK